MKDNGLMKEKDKIIHMVITISRMYHFHVKKISQIWQEEKSPKKQDPSQNGDDLLSIKNNIIINNRPLLFHLIQLFNIMNLYHFT